MAKSPPAGPRASPSLIETADARWAFPAARATATLLAALSLAVVPGGPPVAELVLAACYTAVSAAVAYSGREGFAHPVPWLVADSALVAILAAAALPGLRLLVPVPLVAVYAAKRGPVAGTVAAVLMGAGLGAPAALGYPMPDPVQWGAVVLVLVGTAAVAGALAMHERRARLVAEEMAVTDHLTGLYNQRYFYSRGQEELARARRYLAPLSLLMIDVDEFKAVNDLLGHLSGDVALARVAGAVSSCLRASDLVFRYGGEEFAVLLPETGGAAAREAAERIREAVEGLRVDGRDGRRIPLTVSIGVAEWQGEDDLADLLLRADGAVYGAKMGGRDRVEVSWFRVSRSGPSATPAGDGEQDPVDTAG